MKSTSSLNLFSIPLTLFDFFECPPPTGGVGAGAGGGVGPPGGVGPGAGGGGGVPGAGGGGGVGGVDVSSSSISSNLSFATDSASSFASVTNLVKSVIFLFTRSTSSSTSSST